MRQARIKQAHSDQAPAPGLELSALLEQLRHALHAQNVVAYRPELYESGWDLELSCWVGVEATERELAHRSYVQSSDPDEPTFAAYDPFSVQELQQNRALTTQHLFALEQTAAARHGQLYAALRTGETEQLRVLICEGPRLLGWVGALREEPYQPSEAALLQSLAEPLRRHLLVQRQLSSLNVQHPMIDSLLDALERPALLFSGKGKVEFENQSARTLLAQPGGRELFAALRRAVATRRSLSGFTMTPLAGFPNITLALYTGHEKPLAQALERGRRAWQLTLRQTTFLEHLAHGLSNKEIAAKVGCAEVTVEKQLTQLFRAAVARSRTELMAKLHAL